MTFSRLATRRATAVLAAGMLLACISTTAAAQVFLDFSGVTSNGFHPGIGQGAYTADLTISDAQSPSSTSNSVLGPLYANLDDSHSFNLNAGANGTAGPDGTIGNNTYQSTTQGLSLFALGPFESDFYTVTLNGFSSPPEVIMIMNVAPSEFGGSASITARSGGTDLPIQTWSRYQDQNTRGNSVVEAFIFNTGNTVTIRTAGIPDPFDQTNAVYFIVPDESPVVDEIIFTGVFGVGGPDQHVIGVALREIVAGSPAGRITEVAPNSALTVNHGVGGQIELSWGPSCMATDLDYAVYEGDLTAFPSHAPALCSTGGFTSASILPAFGAAYYLVVPLSGTSEGSYGVDSALVERPAAVSSCAPQAVGCP